jgi:NitT/TauT family transport system substrate-binding protein
MSQAKVPANRIHQKWMLSRIKDLILPPGSGNGSVGILRQEDFERVVKVLVEMKLLLKVPEYKTFSVGYPANAAK